MKAPKKDPPAEVRLIVEVDGNPVGVLNLDIDRLWPLVNHRGHESVPVEWIDNERFQTAMRAAVVQNLVKRLQSNLYRTLGDEMVKAALDAENFTVKADAAAQIFGRTRKEIESLAAESGRSATDFYAFFWECLLDERESVDLKKEWKARKT